MTEKSSDGSALPSGGEPQEERPNARQAFELLGSFLEEDGWHPHRLEDRFVYGMVYNGKNGDIRCYAQVRMDLEQFVFYAVSPIKAGEEVRSDVAEFITRANFGLRIGNFEMDYADGEVRYKSSLDFEKETLTTGWIRNAIYPAVQTMDHYLVGLMRVIFGGSTPLEGIEEVEGNGGASAPHA
jgi:hypothetical protein